MTFATTSPRDAAVKELNYALELAHAHEVPPSIKEAIGRALADLEAIAALQSGALEGGGEILKQAMDALESAPRPLVSADDPADLAPYMDWFFTVRIPAINKIAAAPPSPPPVAVLEEEARFELARAIRTLSHAPARRQPAKGDEG